MKFRTQTIYTERISHLCALKSNTGNFSYYNIQKSRFRYFAVAPDFTPFQEMGQSGNAHITDLQFDAEENLWMSQDDTDEEYVGIRRYKGNGNNEGGKTDEKDASKHHLFLDGASLWNPFPVDRLC